MEPPDDICNDAIRERAYDLWDRHHRPDGFDLEFWFMARRELRSERKALGLNSAASPSAQFDRSYVCDAEAMPRSSASS